MRKALRHFPDLVALRRRDRRLIAQGESRLVPEHALVSRKALATNQRTAHNHDDALARA